MSEAVAGLFGYAPSELVGRNLHLLVPQGLDEIAAAPTPVGVEEREDWVLARRKDGKGFPLRLVTTAKAGVDLVLERSPALEGNLPSMSVRLGPPASASSSPGPGEGADAKPEIERVRRELASALEQQADLTQAVEAATSRAEALGGEVAQAVSARGSDKAWYQARIDELTASLASARQEAAVAQAGRAETAAQVEARESRLAGVTRSFEATRVELAEAKRQLGEEREALRESREALDASLAQATTLTDQLEGQRHQLAAAQQQVAADAQLAQQRSGELESALEQLARRHHEAKALEQATEAIARELAAARVVLATLQHERDAWRARSEQAQGELTTLTESLQRAERQAAAGVQDCGNLEKQIAGHQQGAAEARRALDAAAMALADRTQGLESARRECADHLARMERLAGELQQSREDHLRARQEAQALQSTLPEISRELAAARVILETLRQERDLWQSQCNGTRQEQQALADQLAVSETRHQRLVDATATVTVSLRESLDLATLELIPVIGELRATLARRAESEARLACAQTGLQQETERDEALQSTVRKRLTLPLGEALDQLGLALDQPAGGWPGTAAPTTTSAPATAAAAAAAPLPAPALEGTETKENPAAGWSGTPIEPPLSSRPAATA